MPLLEPGFNFLVWCAQIPGNCKAFFWSQLNLKPVNEMYIYTHTDEALDLIDEESKKYFPLVFLSMMIVYWTTYLYVMEDEILQEVLEHNIHL